jgi:hypothetical protein
MLWPIETWTRKSLQFHPPETQPAGISRQAFPARTVPTSRTAKAARANGARSERMASSPLRGWSDGGGASPGIGTTASRRLAPARIAAVANATGRSKPPAARPTTFAR